MSTKFDIKWPKTNPIRGGKLEDIPANTLVQDLDYMNGGAFGYWDGENTIWFYDNHLVMQHGDDGSLDNCVAVPNATIKIEIEIEE